ncbi:MAG: hypothetical protein HQL62_09405, partial [Magnetococcales bacterium]|nr:hypothetical protein [Magnetococcales bacterium]
TEYVQALWALDCFDVAALSQEDRQRTAMYVAERDRRATRKEVDSPEAWLQQLAMTLRVGRVDTSNLARVTPLFNKTNQLNLSTRRLGEKEVLAWALEPRHALLALSVTDRFGDMGLVGVVGISVNGTRGEVVDFILSCRAMGRRIEAVMLHLAMQEARRLGAQEIDVKYVPTARNRPTLDVLRQIGLKEVTEHLFQASCQDVVPLPEAIQVVVDAPAGSP